jgi:hypothetical protein
MSCASPVRTRENKSMLKVTFLLSLFTLLSSSGCDTQKQDEKIRSLESDVKQLKTEVAELKQKPKAAPEHHYELRKDGFRTFRFDPSTGDLCILLTTDADWKRKETKVQSCDCADNSHQYYEMPTDTEQQKLEAKNYYYLAVRTACAYP